MVLTVTMSAPVATAAAHQDTPSSSPKVVLLSTGLSTPDETTTKSKGSDEPLSPAPGPSPLDALLSPTHAPQDGVQSMNSTAAIGSPTSGSRAKGDTSTGESLDGDAQEVSLEEDDDARFSTVPLSAPPPLSPSPPLTRKSLRLSTISRNDGTEDERSLQTPTTSFSYSQHVRGTKAEGGPAKEHGSTDGLPGADFLLARLEKDTSRAGRASLDGKVKLKEEFDSTRKRAEEREEEKAKEIDWGMFY